MRMLFVMCAFALFLASCSNAENLRAPIESLTTEWDHTTTMVSDFVNTLQSAQQQLQNQFVEMTVPEELTLRPETENQVAELKDGYQEEMSNLTDLSGEVSSYISEWQTEAEKLSELKNSLDSGDLGEEGRAVVDNLQATVGKGKEAVESWQGELEDIQANAGDILEEFNIMIANLQGN